MNNQEFRINYLISLYKKLNPDEPVSRHTLIKNTSIEKLCAYDGGAYQRVKTWIESKVGAELKKEDKADIQEDIRLFREQFDNCFRLLGSRNAKYGDSWRRLRVSSIVDLMMMKLDRCQNQELKRESLEVEVEDIVNYGVILLTKLRNL